MTTLLLIISFFATVIQGIRIESRSNRPQPLGEAAFSVSAVVFLAVGLIALLGVRLGQFSVAFVVVWLLSLYFIARLYLVFWNDTPSRQLTQKQHHLIPTVVLIVICAVVYGLFPTYNLGGGRDHGVYLLFAHHISTTSGLDLDLPWLRDLHARFGDAVRLGYPGIYSAYNRGLSSDPGELIPQFMHLFPSYGAIAQAVAGLEGLVRINVVIGFFALWAFYVVTRRLVGYGAAFIASALLGINASMIWVTRSTFTEPLQIFTLFLGLHLLSVTTEKRSLIWGIITGIVLGAGVFNRLAALLVVLTVVGYAVYVRLHQPRLRKIALGMVFTYLLVSTFALLDGYFHAYPYLADLWAGGSLNKLVVANYFGGIFSVLIIATPLTANWTLRLIRLLPRIFQALTVVVLAWLIVRFTLSYQPDATFAERSVRELSWYITPGIMLFALGGVFLLPQQRQTLAMYTAGVLFVATIFVYTWQPSITPDHFWASRRWLSFCIPLSLLFASNAIIEATRYLKRNALGFLSTAAMILTLVGWYLVSTISLSWPYLFVSLLKSYPGGYEQLTNQLDLQMNDSPRVTRDGSAASILTYVYNVPTVLLNDAGLQELTDNGNFYGLQGLGLAKGIISPNGISLGDRIAFCGKYTERVRGAKPHRLIEWCRRIAPTKVPDMRDNECRPLSISPMHPRLATKVGMRVADRDILASRGQGGILQFGPYIPAVPGSYEIAWYGRVIRMKEGAVIGEVDVVADKGQTVISSSSASAEGEGVQQLASVKLEIVRPYSDIEFRFTVNESLVELHRIDIWCNK